jgi:hypothetical protein
MPLFRSALSAESVDCFSVARDHLDRTMPKDGLATIIRRKAGIVMSPNPKTPSRVMFGITGY